MIQYLDTINQIPYTETTTCDFHRKYPGKPYACCCCSVSIGWRQATPEERRTNLRKRRQEIEEGIKKLMGERARIEDELQCETLKAFLCPACDYWHIGNNRYKTIS